MIQGTMSNVGKSVLVAALCRIFAQDGYRAVPFKSQNMALNSYITAQGLEMGRAQVMQAEAAGVEPIAAMNPILLKPTTDVGSQVIVNGKVLGNMRAKEYFAYKPKLIPEIQKAFSTLEEQADIIVIEGAGSPAELNLKKDDIVNMGLAKLVDAPVLLVGDIDRGGVFAQLVGTCALLEPQEQDRIKGLIVNKFRGDRSLFQDGVRILEEKSGKPVFGVVPFVHCDIDDEDSLADSLSRQEVGLIEIVVIKLPHISNFTDFSVFSQYEGVTVHYVDHVRQLKNPDLIILPGTKSTIGDLKWLRESGLEAAILRQQALGTPVFGICGGYQMLGQTISDPEGVEGGGTLRGLGLLQIETVFRGEKTRTRVTGTVEQVGGLLEELSGCPFEGYEIHMGETVVRDAPFGQILHGRQGEEQTGEWVEETTGQTLDGGMDGAWRGNVYGTYIHGIFDKKEISQTILDVLCKRKGVAACTHGMDRRAYKELQYDKLAQAVRQNVDMEQIYRCML